jgi:hypothetical protein
MLLWFYANVHCLGGCKNLKKCFCSILTASNSNFYAQFKCIAFKVECEDVVARVKMLKLLQIVQNSSEQCQCCAAPPEQCCCHVVQPSILLQVVDNHVNKLQQYWWLNNMITILFTGCNTTLFTAVLNNPEQPDQFLAVQPKW